MKTLIFTLFALACTVAGAPDAGPVYKTPIFNPADQFVNDQPAHQPEAPKPAATFAAPVAPVAPAAPSNDVNHAYNDAQGFSDHYGNFQNYDSGYGAQNGYEGYLVPSNNYYPLATTDGDSLLSYAWSLLPKASHVVKVVAKGAVVLLGLAAVVVVGGLAFFGICTFTPYCHITLSGFNAHTIKEEVRAFITPDRISSVARFVRDAIDKYQNMQKVAEKVR